MLFNGFCVYYPTLMPATVLVTGASGFVGRAVVDALLFRGYNVRAFVRAETSPLPDHPNITRVVGDIRDLHALEGAMAGVAYVVHCAARKNDEKDSMEINIEGTKNVMEACRIAGVKRIVNLSTQSAKLQQKGVYGSTKAEADRLFHASNVPVTTLRSSLVYGDKESGVFGTIVRYSKLPFIPMIGNGKARFRPIHRSDLATIILTTLETSACSGNIYDVGGPDLVSLDEIAEQIMNAQKIDRPILHLPVWMGLAIAGAASFLRNPPLTVSNVLGSTVDVPMDLSPLAKDIGSLPTRTFEQGLTELFGPMPSALQREGASLLRYVLSGVGTWEPPAEAIDRYVTALQVHAIDGWTIPRRVLRSRMRLSGIDTASRLRAPHSPIRQKLLIAAAIAETHPASADALLPRKRSIVMIMFRSFDLSVRLLFSLLFALPSLTSSTHLRTHAGIA